MLACFCCPGTGPSRCLARTPICFTTSSFPPRTDGRSSLPNIKIDFIEYVGGTVRNLEGISLALNGTEDHLHLLAKLRPIVSLADVLRDLKANATGWIHDVFPEL